MNQKYFIKPSTIVFFLINALFTSCYYDNEQDLYGNVKTTCDTTTAVKYSALVSPLIASNCATSGCHNAASASAGVNLSSYDAIKNYIASSKIVFIGSIKQTSGYSKMPKGGSKFADCDIQKIESWINANMPNN